jgi:Fur family peroxide stress response transcriptional regulator
MRTIPRKGAGRRRPASAPRELDVILRARGLRLTGPRRLVLEVVRHTDTHPTAEWVHRMVRRRLPRVSLGTVYRNLRLLVGQGLVKELAGPHARFDGNLAEHHHFMCLSCERMVDVEAPAAEPHSRALSTRVAARTGLSISYHRIEFYGRCPDCRGAPARRRPPGARARRRIP